jgi:hypothetical protein
LVYARTDEVTHPCIECPHLFYVWHLDLLSAAFVAVLVEFVVHVKTLWVSEVPAITSEGRIIPNKNRNRCRVAVCLPVRVLR